MRPKRVENCPYGFECSVFEGIFGIKIVGNEHWKNNCAKRFIVRFSYCSAYGLDDVHLARSWINKCDTVKGWDVYAFCEASRVG